MYLKNIDISQFRNISREKIEFSENINLIHGKNGQGKTSLLEAIYYLSITKSFRAKSDKTVLQHDKEYMQISGLFEKEKDSSFSVRLYFSQEDGKHVFLNTNKLDKFSQILGWAPLSLLSLEDLELTYGFPGDRRKFVDILLSQTSPVYLQALQAYKKALAHRNRLLSLIAEKKEKPNILFPWDEQLAQYAAEIISLRNDFVEYANLKISKYYQRISLKNEQIQIKYRTNTAIEGKSIDIKKTKQEIIAALAGSAEADIQRQNTATGPHRDDLIFYKDGYALKAYGSQGENKTLLIALKLVESEYLKDKTKQNPILLMDDIFGELDEERINNLLEYVAQFGQTFITTTKKDNWSNLSSGQIKTIAIDNGQVINVA